MKTTMRWMVLVAAVAASCGEVTAMMETGGAGAGGDGSSGMGGAGGSQSAQCPIAADLLSDFTATAVLAEVDGRHGAWRTYGDRGGAGSLLQPPESASLPLSTAAGPGNQACSGGGSLHVTASGFTDWGAAMFVPLASAIGEQPSQPYNASRFAGVSFWARATAPMKAVRVEAWDVYTASPTVLSADQGCVYAAGLARNCSPYGAAIGDGLIDSTWRRFEVRFADMKQDPSNPGQKSPGDVVDSSRLTTLAIRVGPSQSWELWVDDVSFVGR